MTTTGLRDPIRQDIAVVVPCFREENRLDTEALIAFSASAPRYRFVLVDDGSDDGTLRRLEQLQTQLPATVEVLALPTNGGKAEAVRRGVLQALKKNPRFVAYWDADWATPLSTLPLFEAVFTDHRIDVVLGARVALLGRKIERKPIRHYLGRIFATAASQTLHLAVYDTQCGAKMFRVTPETQQLFEAPFSSRWLFDVELLARYLTARRGSEGLYELPLPEWTDVGESKVSKSDFLRGIGELSNIYQRYPLGQPLRRLVLLATGVFSRYALVGGLGTAAHYAVLVVCIEGLQANVSVAAVAGASVGALANYLLNYHLTFQSRSSHRQALPRFAVVAALGIVGSGFGVTLGTDWGLHYLTAQILCTVLVLVLGFGINRAWTFSR